MRTQAANDGQFQYWNGDKAAHWLANEVRYEAMLSPFTDDLLRAAGALATEGRALGVDLSHQLLRRGEQRTREEGLANVGFEHADVQVHAFAGPGFDAAISRFGTMFFADPVVAFANVAHALRPGGRLAFVCWADALDNEWIAVPGVAAGQHVALPPLGDPGRAGPFSLADRDRLHAILGEAGLVDVEVEAHSAAPLGLGPRRHGGVSEGDRHRPGAVGGADAATSSRVTAAIAAALEPHLTEEGVRLGSKAWLVTAHLPA
jgi:SAM-dependent methyltransferase